MRLENAIHTIQELLEDGDDADVFEIVDECSTWTLQHILNKLSGSHQKAVNEIIEAAKEAA